jgi:hypothetical protein
MKTFILIVIIFFSSIASFAQVSFVYDSTHYKFYVGVAEPDSNWRKQLYIDSAWQTGKGSIGYGVNGLNMRIQKTTSVYLRFKFIIKDLHEKIAVTTMGLSCDFNDGYVAYLNGKEIARTNLGKPGTPIPFNGVTDRAHKTATLTNRESGYGLGYYIDYSKIKQSLDTGTNVLAIQVHNDSINGSDLSFACWFDDITGLNGGSMGSHFYRQVELDSTKFPIIIINSDSDIIYPKNSYKAKMGIINNLNKSLNKPTGNFTDYDGRISIKIHGQSSSGFDKKSYVIETEDSAGNNYNVPLIGMPAENDWVLFGPFADKSQIRNELAFNLGRKLGHYEPRTRFCELILNGDFRGLYVLTEKIKRDSNRVDIDKLKKTDNNGDSVTGGYIFRYDKDSPDSGSLIWVYPKREEITLEQKKYIFDYVNEFYNVLGNPIFSDPELGYAKYIDVQSLIDHIIAEEAMKNCDAYFYSTYLYKENITDGGKIKYGPLWDHDLAFGNGSFQDGCNTNGWQFEEFLVNGYSNNSLEIMKIMRDSNFVRKFQDKWHEVRKSFLNTDSMMVEIDSLTHYINDAQMRNYLVWPVINNLLFGSCPNVSTTYIENITNMKIWVRQRLLWIDNNISIIGATLDIPSVPFGSSSKINVFPNPFINTLAIGYNSESSESITCSIYNMLGRRVYNSELKQFGYENNKYNFNPHFISNLSNGIYLLVVYKNGVLLGQTKLVKN